MKATELRGKTEQELLDELVLDVRDLMPLVGLPAGVLRAASNATVAWRASRWVPRWMLEFVRV